MNTDKTLEQHLAFERLKKTFDEGVVRPERFGQTQPSLRDAIAYDTPGHLKDWSQDKRKVVASDLCLQ